MLEWALKAADRVEAEAKKDPEYRELADRQAALVHEFDALLERLSPDDRELLLEYMDVVGNLQYRMTQLAYRYGKGVGRTQVISSHLPSEAE